LIYRKVYYITLPASNPYLPTSLNIDNFGTLVNISGIFTVNSNSVPLFATYRHDSDSVISAFVQGSILVVYSPTGTYSTSLTGYVILEYTKT
jgi:hypothetical protein